MSDDMLPRQVAIGLDAATRLIQSLAADVKETTVFVVTIKAELANLSDEVKQLSHLIKDGNGSDSILVRLALLEQQTNSLETTVVKLTDNLDKTGDKVQSIEQFNKFQIETETGKSEQKKTTTNNRLQIVIAVITGIISIIIAVASAIFARP